MTPFESVYRGEKVLLFDKIEFLFTLLLDHSRLGVPVEVANFPLEKESNWSRMSLG
jgi:hypothetical protein